MLGQAWKNASNECTALRGERRCETNERRAKMQENKEGQGVKVHGYCFA